MAAARKPNSTAMSFPVIGPGVERRRSQRRTSRSRSAAPLLRTRGTLLALPTQLMSNLHLVIVVMFRLVTGRRAV
jgi:hypothetical protein